tara:strand:+ start:16987 stop:17391 length:405 start_codon:yes stop_codon:yes gene_type:complete
MKKFKGWNNFLNELEDDTKIVAKAVIYVDEKILMLKKAKNSKWDLPGGHLVKGETVLQGLKREIKEETGLYIDTSVAELVQKSAHKFYYKLPLPDGIISLSGEHTEYRFISKSDIDNHDISRNYKNVIKKSFIG